MLRHKQNGRPFGGRPLLLLLAYRFAYGTRSTRNVSLPPLLDVTVT